MKKTRINHTTHPAGLRREKEGKNMWKHVKTIEKYEYVVLFYRKYIEEKCPMSTTSSLTISKPTDDFYLSVRKFRTNRFGQEVADCASESFDSKIFNRDTANWLWFNIKSSTLSYNGLLEIIKDYDIWEAENL